MKTLNTEVVGMQFRITMSTRRLLAAHVREQGPLTCRLEREPKNPHDENAIRVLGFETPYRNMHLGYIPRGVAEKLARKIDRKRIDEITVYLADMRAEDGDGDLVIRYKEIGGRPTPKKKSPGKPKKVKKT